MSRNDAGTEEKITLASRLSDIARVPPWLGNLASRDGIPERIRFGMDLCLEEILSNIIRHGYRGAPGHAILVTYGNPRRDTFSLVIEDEAPPFNPLRHNDRPVCSLDDVTEGGHGIHLIRQFANQVDYEPTASGNRLTISFVVPETAHSAR